MTPSRWYDDDNEEEFDDGYDDESNDDEESELIACPECGASIHEESERCPVCAAYIAASSSVWYGRPWWWIALGALGLGGAVLAMILGS